MAHQLGHAPTAQQLSTFANLAPQQQTQLSNLTQQQRQGLSGLAALTPQQRQGLSNLPQQQAGGNTQQILAGQGFDVQRMIANGVDPTQFLAERNRRQGLEAQGLAPFQAGAPPTGLIGSEQAIQQGLGSQLGLLAQGIGSAQGEIDLATGQARGDIAGGFDPAIGSVQKGFQQAGQTLDPFGAGGAGAAQQQAALSGALGPEAQQQAFQAFTQSPGQQFLVEQGEQAILRNAAATGGLGGGNVLRALNRQGIGQAQQFFQQGFNNLGQVTGRGQQIAGAQAGLQSAGGQAVGGLQVVRGQNLANIAQQGGVNLSNLALQGGVLPAQAVGAAANTLSTGRLNTGVNLANAAANISTGQSNLQSQLGIGLANQFGQGATNIANLTSGTGAQSAQLQQNLATILANIGTGSASQAAGFTNAASQFDAAGILGQNTAVQNTLAQLLQLIPQGGSSQPPPQIPAAGSNFGGGTTPAFNAGAFA